MREAFLDTSVVIALAEGDDRVVGSSDFPRDTTGVVSAVTVAETASLAAQYDHPTLVDWLLDNVRIEPTEIEDMAAAGDLHGRLRRDRPQSKVSLIDCIIYASSQRLGQDLWTLDADLKDQPGVRFTH